VADLMYTANISLDGYTADATGNFDFTAPTDEVHAFINDLERPLGTYLYGRRLYDTMLVWEHPETVFESPAAVTADYARIWQAAEKVVYSTTLDAPVTARTRIERSFDVEKVRAMKAAAGADLGVGGATLAAQALAAGLVDELRLFIYPVVVGAGNPALPDGWRVDLDLIDERRFDGGVVHVRYRTR
jgi:dihydrofolate reductase